jgi:AhpD family alkylhydroperoxidase
LHKQLLAVAVALTTPCPYCIELFVRQEREAGATDQVLTEVAIFAAPCARALPPPTLPICFTPRGIRVNAVAPSVIETAVSNFTKTDAGRDLALGMHALKRSGKPDDVADVIVCLASDGPGRSPARAFQWTGVQHFEFFKEFRSAS